MQLAPRRVRDDLVLRMATREDAHACARILKESADDGLVARSDEVDPGQLSRQIEAARAASNSLFIVAVTPTPAGADDDVVVGLLLLEGAPLMRLHDVARITMAVTPNQRNHGIGRALLQHAMACADESGLIRKIELLTRANNERALALYLSLGFVEEGRLRARLKLEDGTFVDDVCMARFKP
ncbi:MAG: GNAT family N-acetyltransferase [Polyangiales bacterium]